MEDYRNDVTELKDELSRRQEQINELETKLVIQPSEVKLRGKDKFIHDLQVCNRECFGKIDQIKQRHDKNLRLALVEYAENLDHAANRIASVLKFTETPQ